MKFTNGEHLLRKGVGISHPYEVRNLDIDPRQVTIYAPPHNVENRFFTIDCMLFTIRIFSPLPDVIGVQIIHYQGVYDKGPDFTINHRDDFPVIIDNLSDAVYFGSGNVKVRIQKENGFSLDFYHGDSRITGSGFKSIGYITDISDIAHTGTDVYLREQLTLGVGECIYGLGERFTPFVKNGQSVDIWNADGTVFDTQGSPETTITISRKGRIISIEVQGKGKSWSLCFKEWICPSLFRVVLAVWRNPGYW